MACKPARHSFKTVPMNTKTSLSRAVFDLPAETDLRALGARLGTYLRAGDTLCLTGELGAGKTTFSRGLIQSLCGADTEVPSPTYTLLQTYSAPDYDIWHFDLYRLKTPGEVWELGMEDAIYDGVTLIEWPQQMGELIPDGTLDIEILFHGEGRQAAITMTPQWQERLREL